MADSDADWRSSRRYVPPRHRGQGFSKSRGSSRTIVNSTHWHSSEKRGERSTYNASPDPDMQRARQRLSDVRSSRSSSDQTKLMTPASFVENSVPVSRDPPRYPTYFHKESPLPPPPGFYPDYVPSPFAPEFVPQSFPTPPSAYMTMNGQDRVDSLSSRFSSAALSRHIPATFSDANKIEKPKEDVTAPKPIENPTPVQAENKAGHPVALLQEHMARLQKPLPVYALVSATGPSHLPTFRMEVKVLDKVYTACARSKKEAKSSVAQVALDDILKGKVEAGKREEEVGEREKETSALPLAVSVAQESPPASASSFLETLSQLAQDQGLELTKKAFPKVDGKPCSVLVSFMGIVRYGSGNSLQEAYENAAGIILNKVMDS